MATTAAEYFELGKSLSDESKWQEALQAFQDAVGLDPQNAEYHAHLALTYYDLDDCEQGLESANYAIQLNPACANAYRARGLLLHYFFDDKYDSALQDANRAIQLDSTNHKSYVLRGRIYEQLESYDAAASDFQLAIQLAPEYAAAHAALGKILIGQEKYDQAMPYLNKAIELDPSDARSHVCCGLAYAAQGKYQKAIQDLDEGIRLLPDSNAQLEAQAYAIRGHVNMELNNYQQAVVDLARYYEVFPNEALLDETGQSPEYKAWAQLSNEHFTGIILPQLKAGGERLVEFTLCMLLWNTNVETYMYDGKSGKRLYGTYGTGYICFTDKNVRLVVLRKLSQQYPLIKKGVVLGLIDFLASSVDHRKAELQDRVWVIPNHTISGAQIVDNYIALVTPAMQWEVYLADEELPWVITLINMSMSGRLAEIWTLQPEGTEQHASPASTTAEEAMDLLRQLGELKTSGLLSEAEFEEKKKELLGRI